MAPSAQPAADAARDPAYAPRSATERVLEELAVWLEGPVATAVVAGAPGAGTTFVLRTFERSERARRPVLFSPFLHIEQEALERWLGGLAFASPQRSLDAWLAGAPGAAPLLLVDEAHAATPATLEALARLRDARSPQLRVCLGGCAGPALERAGRAVGGADALVIELPPWSGEELRGLAEALCALPAPGGEPRDGLGTVDPAALASAADGSPGLLRDAWIALRDRGSLPTAIAPAAPVAAPAAPAPVEIPKPQAAEGVPAALPAAPEPAPAPRVPSLAPSPRPPAAQTSPHRKRAPLYHAGALCLGFVLGFVGGWRGWEDWGDADVAVEEAPEPIAPAAVASAPPEPAPPTPTYHDVQVNARPWAWIKIDGKSVGVTPLVQRDLASGEHQFEATFPDGRQQQRTVAIGPDSRFVSFPE